MRAAHRDLLEGGHPQRVTVRLRRKDGSWVWVETIARVVRDQHSRPVGIQSTTRDITETKAAVDALEAAREHFRRAFDDAPIGMGIVDPRGRFERVNDAICQLLGYSEEELVGRVNPLDLMHPDDRGGEGEGLREMLRGERRTFAIEKRLIHKDGHRCGPGSRRRSCAARRRRGQLPLEHRGRDERAATPRTCSAPARRPRARTAPRASSCRA